MFIFIFLVAMYFLLKWATKLVNTLAQEHNDQKNFDRDYKERTMRALERVSDSLAPETPVEPERSKLECLLEGNRKILEKKKVRQAMETELKIKW